MKTFTHPSGIKITTQRVGNNIEFVTYNLRGEVISSVQRTFAESVPLLKRLAATL